jgi:ribonuclease P protein component
MTSRSYHETHLSTIGDSPQAYSRFSCSYGHPWGSCSDSCPPRQGPAPFGRLNAISSGQKSRRCLAGFPRRYRLTRTDEFSSVFSFRKAIRSPTFLLHYRPHEGGQSDGARLGLVIAKRHLRRSVDRNLVKRLVREVFRTRRSEMPSCDLIVRLAIKPALPINRRALAGEIRNLLEKMCITGPRS